VKEWAQGDADVDADVDADADAHADAGAGAPADRDVREAHVRAVRVGHGANCSSVGSVIDTLFVSAAIGGAIFAAVLAAMKTEKITVVGAPPADAAPQAKDASDAAAGERP